MEIDDIIKAQKEYKAFGGTIHGRPLCPHCGRPTLTYSCPPHIQDDREFEEKYCSSCLRKLISAKKAARNMVDGGDQ